MLPLASTPGTYIAWAAFLLACAYVIYMARWL